MSGRRRWRMAELCILELANLLAKSDERDIGFSSDRLPDALAIALVTELIDAVVDLDRPTAVHCVSGPNMPFGSIAALR